MICEEDSFYNHQASAGGAGTSQDFLQGERYSGDAILHSSSVSLEGTHTDTVTSCCVTKDTEDISWSPGPGGQGILCSVPHRAVFPDWLPVKSPMY